MTRASYRGCLALLACACALLADAIVLLLLGLPLSDAASATALSVLGALGLALIADAVAAHRAAQEPESPGEEGDHDRLIP